MGRIYSGVNEFTVPKLTNPNSDTYINECKKYIEQIKQFAKKNGKGAEAGKEISFPVGDGKAIYIVLSLKPIKLIHLDIYDCWNFPYINRLTAKDIKEKIKQQEKINKLFKE